MNRRRWIIFGLVLLLVVLPLLIQRAAPRYCGSTAQEWLNHFGREVILNDAGSNAFFHLGPKGVLFLKRKTSSGKALTLDGLWMRARSQLPGWMGSSDHLSAAAQQEAAESLLTALKPDADILLPLVEGDSQSPDTVKRRRAYWLMGCAGPGAEKMVPHLVRGLKDPDSFARTVSVLSLGNLGAASAPATAEPVPLIRDGTDLWNGTIALGQIGPGAAVALPALRRRWDQTIDPKVRMLLARAICLIDLDEKEALKYLEQVATNHPEQNVREIAVIRLGELGKRAETSKPIMEEFMTRDQSGSWFSAFAALAKIETNESRLLPLLQKKLDDTAPTNRNYNLKGYWLWLGLRPADARKINDLLTICADRRERGPDRFHALSILEYQAQLNEAGIKKLEHLSKNDPDANVRKVTRNSLKRIRKKAELRKCAAN